MNDNPERQNGPDYDSLLAYAMWFQAQPFSIPPSIGAGVTRVDKFSGVVLHRFGQHQVQLWIADPNSVIPKHSHPNVDSLAHLISGDLEFWVEVDGQEVKSLRAMPGTTHRAMIGPRGACFLTFHEFRHGSSPTSVTEDWKGEPLGPEHAKALSRDAEEDEEAKRFEAQLLAQ